MISPFPKKKATVEVAKVALSSTENCPVCGSQLSMLYVNIKGGRVKTGVCLEHRVCLPQIQGA